MFLHDLGVGLLRRWYLVLFGLLVTGFGAYSLLQVVPVTYEATSSVVLVPPATAVIEGENPYLYMGGLDQALSVLTVRMSSPTVGDPILKKRPGLNYSVGKDVSTAGPIMLVGADGETEAETLKLLEQVTKVIPENLQLLQDQLNIPKNARITAMNIVTDTSAKEVNKKQMRAVLAAIAGGTAVTILGTGLIDRMVMRRKEKRARRSEASADNGKRTGKVKKKVPAKAPKIRGPEPAELVLVPSPEATDAAKSGNSERHRDGSRERQLPEATIDSDIENLTSLSTKP